MQNTANYGFNKPEVTDNYNVENYNQNFDIIDETLKTVADKAESSTTHPTDKENPHGVTAAQVGLGNVPNVATNDQTPTYVVATENAALSSGEKLSAAFGKIAKAITSLISHLADTTSHVTSTERTTWNGKANGTHTHTKSQISDFPSSMPASDVYAWAKASSKPSYTKSEVGLGNVDNTADSAKSVKYATSAGSANAVAWGNVSGKPSSFTPSSHSHAISEISGTVPVTISSSQPSSGLWVVP